MARGDERNRAQAAKAARQGPADNVEVLVARMVDQRTRGLETKIAALERRLAVLEAERSA